MCTFFIRTKVAGLAERTSKRPGAQKAARGFLSELWRLNSRKKRWISRQLMARKLTIHLFISHVINHWSSKSMKIPLWYQIKSKPLAMKPWKSCNTTVLNNGWMCENENYMSPYFCTYRRFQSLIFLLPKYNIVCTLFIACLFTLPSQFVFVGRNLCVTENNWDYFIFAFAWLNEILIPKHSTK